MPLLGQEGFLRRRDVTLDDEAVEFPDPVYQRRFGDRGQAVVAILADEDDRLRRGRPIGEVQGDVRELLPGALRVLDAIERHVRLEA